MAEETSSTSSSDNPNEFIELEIPIFVELKQSLAANDLGSFSRIEISADQFLGSYKGKHKKSISQCADPNYVWTILSSRQMPLFYIDASDPNDSNWLRFIRSTSDPRKYNVICMQQNQQINYFTFKSIKEGEELLTYLPGKRKKPKNKAYANLSFKLYDESSRSEIYPETEIDYTEEKTHMPDTEILEADEPNSDDLVELKLSDDVKKKEDYFFSIGFSLKLKNMKKSLKRQLIKCDLCTYAFVIDSKYDYDRIIKTHVIDEHLSRTEEDKSSDQIVSDVCEWMIRQVENPIATENTFDYYFKFDSNKTKYDLLNSNLRCFYCSYETQCDQESVSCYLKHLVKRHQNEIKKDQLISDIDENKLTDHDLNLINWSDYFRLSFRDHKFPSDKYNKSKTWTCQLCKKQFEQRIDLSKHQCIELNLKLLKKKKELRKKRWKETHWKRKIDLSYIETSALNHISSNICDNLTFCVDGTKQDLKSYSKEVKDYLNSHLSKETQVQMVLKCCFPDLYTQLLKKISNLNESNAAKLIQEYLLNEASNYFTNRLNCHKCKHKFDQLSNYIDHEKLVHQNDKIDSGPVGYLGCDLVGYLLNLYWDSVLHRQSNLSEQINHSLDQIQATNEHDLMLVNDIVDEFIDDVKVEQVRGTKKRMASENLEEEVVKKRVVNNDESEKRSMRRSTRSSLTADVQTEPIVEEKKPLVRTSSRARNKLDTSTEAKESKNEFMSVKVVNNKKIHTCDRCDLEFTSSNSVTRHQEKSCLRVKVISFESKSKSKAKSAEIKKKCPICGFVFSNTHQLSIHIYRQHRSLLGSASYPPSDEAVRLNQEQLTKAVNVAENSSDDDQASLDQS